MRKKEYVDYIWHYKVEDNLDWDFCSGILMQDDLAHISPQELQQKFEDFFVGLTGIAPYAECPVCGASLLPRKSRYGYFVGCSKYPECDFLASKTRLYQAK